MALWASHADDFLDNGGAVGDIVLLKHAVVSRLNGKAVLSVLFVGRGRFDSAPSLWQTRLAST